MDDIDQKLLKLLQKDGRSSATKLAKRLGVSRGTVQNRIERMLDLRVIQRFTLELGAGASEQQVSAFSLLRVKSEADLIVLAALRRVPGVLEVSTLSGSNDLVVEIRAVSLTELDQTLNKIRAIPDVVETHSNIRLTTTPALV